MGTRLTSVVIDCTDHTAQGHWWAETLGWTVAFADDREVLVEPTDHDETDLALVFVPVPEPRTGKNRIHLDLASTTTAHQAEIVERVLARGATPSAEDGDDVTWVVLADPEGNMFCVVPPDKRFDEPGTLAAVVVDAAEPGRLARFWTAASGWPIFAESHLVARLCRASRRPPALDLVAVPDPTPGKNRLHLDVAPARDAAQQTEVDRLLRLGAQPADVGQRDVSWVVLNDPEGNEFCVLSPR